MIAAAAAPPAASASAASSPSSYASASAAAAARLLGIDAETSMQQVLEREVVEQLRESREATSRLDAYLLLLDVFRLEDTPESVQLLCQHAPAVLHAIHEDLRHATLPDVRHVALQALSYLLHQPTLASSFHESEIERVVSAVITLQASTQLEVRASPSRGLRHLLQQLTGGNCGRRRRTSCVFGASPRSSSS
ncbi:hypothetical protein PINS_up001594 [Pythium insidiosum]|nr:hypothetical protein PINS_up001594 [Pythium insidiosum]